MRIGGRDPSTSEYVKATDFAENNNGPSRYISAVNFWRKDQRRWISSSLTHELKQ